MRETDQWFHDQLPRSRPTSRPTSHSGHASASPKTAAGLTQRHVRFWRRSGGMVIAGAALAALVSVFAGEATFGSMRADQPFGLTTFYGVLQAGSLPPVNSHAPANPARDRNAIATAGISARR